MSIGDNQYNKLKNGSGNAKGIREVLINLHDQFEELNSYVEPLIRRFNSKCEIIT